MEELYKYFSWGFIVIGGVSGVGLLIRHFTQTKVNYYFNKQLEQYKHDLAIITENAKYDINKKLYDFEAYASKKHVVYPELYRIIYEIWQELTRFRYEFDGKLKNSKQGISEDELSLYYYEKLAPVSIKIMNVYEYFGINELYLSKTISIAFEQALDAQSDFMNTIENDFFRNLETDSRQDPDFWLIDNDRKYQHEATEKLNMLKETVYKELSYTHSEKTEKKEEALS